METALERAWIYGRYVAYWEFNFERDEYANSNEAYEQVLAETLGYCE